MKWLPVVAAVAAASLAAGAQAPPNPPLAFTRATLLDPATGQQTSDATLIVTGNRITAAGPATTVAIPPGARTIDASGRFLIPGLWDMHAHLGAGGAAVEIDMPLLVANGVTGVREMWSDCPAVTPVDCLARQREWQRQVDRGEVVGPRVLALGSWPVNGPGGPPGGFPPGAPEFFNAATEVQGRELARYFASRRVDFIKIYPLITRDGFLGLADEARRLGLSLAGHEAGAVGAIEASNAGQRSFEHARVFLYTCFPGAAEFSRTRGAPNNTWRRRMVDEHDPVACQRVFETFVKNGTRYVPTHLTRKIETLASDPALARDARLKYVRQSQVAEWRKNISAMAERYASAEARQSMSDLYTRGLAITGAAHKAGVPVMLGTDLGDTFVFAGSSVHDELEELVKAGLSPQDALEAATWSGAQFFGRTAEFGSLTAGKIADLVILEANPFLDIRNTRRISGVVLNGRHLDRPALDGLLREAERAASR